MDFNDFKNEILRRAKEAGAHSRAYRRAYQSNDYSELMQVIQDNFDLAVRHGVIDPSLIETYKDQFTENQIYSNVDVTAGFLLAWGNATVRASGNAYIISYDTIECKLRNNAIYRILKSNTVRYVSDNINFEKVPAYEPEGTETKQD